MSKSDIEQQADDNEAQGRKDFENQKEWLEKAAQKIKNETQSSINRLAGGRSGDE